MACSWNSDDCSDEEIEERNAYIYRTYRSRQVQFRRPRMNPGFHIDDFSEEDVFRKLVISGGLSSISQYTEEKVPEESFARWLEGRRKKLSVYIRRNKPICIGPFMKQATLCIEHSGRKCSRLNCSHFHICSFYLNGICRRGRSCKKGHEFEDVHNQEVIKNLELEEFSNEEIRTIILCRYPQVCRSETCSLEEDCPYLHICYNFLKNKCEAVQCKRGHSLDTPHNKWVLRVYRMDRWSGEKLALMKALINMPRQQKQIDYSKQDTQLDYYSWSEDMPCEETKSKVSSNLKAETRKLGMFKDLSTFSTSSIVDIDSHKKDICLDHLVGTCPARDCHKHHTRLPYLWQIHLYGEWLSFDEVESQSLEQKYCNMEDTAKAKIFSKGEGKEVTLHFKEEYGTCTGELGFLRLKFRRLSTASFATENAPMQRGSFHTQWRWYLKNDYHQWMRFDKDELQYTLEKKYITGQKSYLFTRESHKFKYRISFDDWQQKNLDTHKVRKILRRPIYVSRTDIVSKQFPERLTVVFSDPHPLEWNALDLAHEFELVEMEETLTEFIGVKTAFFAKLDDKSFKICNIYRIQNLALWNEYKMKKMNLEKTHAKKTGGLDERTLFHGTDSYDTCYGICTNNFDFRLSGKNATVYGKGSYFAVSAKYSHNYTRGPIHLMFQAKVLIGSYTKGSGDMTCPPNIPGEGHRRYDSCVDNTTSPSIFVVFDRNQCYPEYLIAYQRKSSTRTAAAVQNTYQTVTSAPALGRNTHASKYHPPSLSSTSIVSQNQTAVSSNNSVASINGANGSPVIPSVATSIASAVTTGGPGNSLPKTPPTVRASFQSTPSAYKSYDNSSRSTSLHVSSFQSQTSGNSFTRSRVGSQNTYSYENPRSNLAGRKKSGCTIQ